MVERRQTRLEGSLWNKGTAGVVVGGVILLALLIWVAAIRWFLGISVVIGLLMAGIIHWWNEHRPVEPEDKGEIRLHLMDDDQDQRKRG